MGMFDYIKIEDETVLPKPDFELNINDFEFQTKSFYNSMEVYIIGKDRRLYKDESEYRQDSVKQLINYHGIINFGAYLSTDVIDHHLEYEAKFTDGILQDIKLLEYKTYEHESRQKKWNEQKEKWQKEQNKITNKLIRFLQKSLIVFLNFLGFKFEHYTNGILRSKNYIVSFHVPKIILGFKSSFFGFSIRNTNTECRYCKLTTTTEFSFKFLGLGLIVNKFKDQIL